MADGIRVYLDTEFDGFGGRLLSMALVGDGGPEWYEVADDKAADPWVLEHVVPNLDRAPIGLLALRRSLHAFLRQLHGPIEVIADWHADLAHFFEAFHGADYTESLDFACTARLLSGPSDVRPEVPHNALSDARALRDWHTATSEAPHV